MAAVYLGTLLAILFGIQHTLGKTVSKDCGTLRYDEPAVEGRNVTLYFEPAKISTKTVGMEWLMLAGGGWKLIDNPRFRTLNFSLTVSTVQLDHRREIRAKYGACTIQIEISLIVIDQYSCGRWVKRSKEAVKLGETLEISYFPPSNIMKSTDPQYVQWITVTNSTCPAPRGCDVTNVSGVYNIRHNPITHEYVLSIVMRLDYDVTGRYRLQCTNRTTNKYTGYINVTVPAMDKNSCGLWIRKTLNDVRIGETLELSYTPTKNIMKSTDPVYVQWITVTNSTCPAPQGCDVTNVSGVYNIRHNPITHEYVLSIVMRPDYDLTGRYRLQCTNRTTDVKYTDYIYVTVPVKPDDPVLQETQTISGCDNCLIGTLGKNIQVQCRVSGGTEPLEVRINVLNQTVTPPREASGLYRAQFVMIEQMHLTDVVCSVSNLALTTPLVTDARIYVAVEPRGFQFPITEAKADMPLTFPYCTSGGARPPSSVTLHVLGLTNSTVETGHVTNVTEDDMYTTTARALSMRRAWNWQSIECCVGHITYKGPICNMHPIVYKFPPKSVNISLGYNHTELEPFYKYTVVSTIFRAWPACRAVWELPEHVIKLDEKADRNLDGPGKAYTTVAYVDLHVSRHDNEKLVTCTAKCKDFESETHAQHEINVPGLVSGQDSSLGKSSSDGDTYMLLVVVLGCCLVLAVTIIVVVIVVVVLRRRSARRKSDIQGADSGLREERQINAEGDNDSNSVADSDDNSDAHVYNAIESSKVQPSIYTGLELSSSNDVPAAGSSNARFVLTKLRKPVRRLESSFANTVFPD